MAQDWFDQMTAPGASPVAQDPIVKRGGPDPYQVGKDQLKEAQEAERLAIIRAAAARAAAADARTAKEWDATHNPDGSEKPKPVATDGDKIARATRLKSLVEQINRVQELYSQDIGPEEYGVFSSAGDYLPTDANSRFDVAGTQLSEKGLAAFRIPGTGTVTDRDATIFERANMPTSSTRDVAIEEQLRGMRARVDEEMAGLGLPAPAWKATIDAPPEEQKAIPGATVPGGVDRSRNINEIDAGPKDPVIGFETGATRYEDDPALAGVLNGYRERLGRGDSVKDIVAYLRSAGVKNSGVFDTVRQQVEFRKRNPNVPINNYDINALDDRAIPQSVARQVTSAIAGSPVGVAAMNVGDAVTGFSLDSMTANPELTRAGIEQVNRDNPGSALAGQIVGGGLAAAGAQSALMRAGVTAGRAGLAADVGYGAIAGAGADDDNRARGAGVGALAGLGGNLVGQGATNALGKAVGGVSSPSVNALADKGIPLTLGQAVGDSGIVGRGVKGIEDRMAGLPGVGDVINARRTEGVEAFNAKAFDHALKPINANVGGKFGEEAVVAAQQAVSDAYTRALAGKAVAADAPFANQLGRAVGDVAGLPRLGGEVMSSVQAILEPYMQGGQLTGDAMQQISRELQALKASYKTDPLKSRVNKAVDEVEDSVFGLFRRQAPEVLPAYNRAKAAARRLYIIEDAVLKAKNRGGVFTPGQLGMADRSGMSKYGGKRGAAAGKSPFHGFQRDAQNVLPNNVPDSGTAGRLAALAVPGAIAGSGAGVGYASGDGPAGAATGLTLAGALALAYTKAGQRALVAGVAKRGPKAKAAARAIKDAAGRIGAITGGGAAAILPQE